MPAQFFTCGACAQSLYTLPPSYVSLFSSGLCRASQSVERISPYHDRCNNYGRPSGAREPHRSLYRLEPRQTGRILILKAGRDKGGRGQNIRERLRNAGNQRLTAEGRGHLG